MGNSCCFDEADTGQQSGLLLAAPPEDQNSELRRALAAMSYSEREALALQASLATAPQAAVQVMAVMRHSVRVDADPAAEWPGRMQRPFDTPISDFALPAEQAQLMRDSSLKFDLIVCSPYRRCLQTAAVVAHQLGITRLRLNKSLGEMVCSVKRCQREVLGEDRADGVVEYLPEIEQLAILREHSQGVVQQIERHDGFAPRPTETHQQGSQRYQDELMLLRDACCLSEGVSVLVVAHGDTVDGAVRAFTGEVCYETQECCWVAVAFDGNGSRVVARNRLETMAS